jgi:putative flippase GtrA
MNSSASASPTISLRPLNSPTGTHTTVLRWLKFNFVGALGIVVQLCTLATLITGLHLDYTWATALAVEATLVHNFLWHEQFTWSDRKSPTRKQSLLRFAKFNLTTGAFSIAGNVLLMDFFINVAHISYLRANLLTIACCSVANFVLSDGLVFSPPRVQKGRTSPRNKEGMRNRTLNLSLTPEPSDQVKHDGKHDAQQNRGS